MQTLGAKQLCKKDEQSLLEVCQCSPLICGVAFSGKKCVWVSVRAANGPVAIDKGWKHVRAEVVLDTFAGRLHEGDVDVTKNLRTGKPIQFTFNTTCAAFAVAIATAPGGWRDRLQGLGAGAPSASAFNARAGQRVRRPDSISDAAVARTEQRGSGGFLWRGLLGHDWWGVRRRRRWAGERRPSWRTHTASSDHGAPDWCPRCSRCSQRSRPYQFGTFECQRPKFRSARWDDWRRRCPIASELGDHPDWGRQGNRRLNNVQDMQWQRSAHFWAWFFATVRWGAGCLVGSTGTCPRWGRLLCPFSSREGGQALVGPKRFQSHPRSQAASQTSLPWLPDSAQ